MRLTLIVSANVKRYRKEAGLTQEALAYKAKLSPDYIGRLERGEESISINNLERVAKVLKIDPVRLLDQEKRLN